MAKKLPQKPDRDSYFEVLDRAHMMSKFFNESLVKHPVVKTNRHLKDTCNQIALLLGDLVQASGSNLWDIDDAGGQV